MSGTDSEKQPKSKKKVNKGLRVLAIFLVAVFLILTGIQTATSLNEKFFEQWTPDYGKVDIGDILSKEKDELDEEDYETLYAQTGLTKIGIDRLYEADARNAIKRIQDDYFAPRTVLKETFNLWTYWEKIENARTTFGAVRAGDIIVTSATQVMGFRYGHAALILNDGIGSATILEATSPGSLSSESGLISSFGDYATFMILRPNPKYVSEETRKEIAEFGKTLVDVPYSVFSGIFHKKNPTTLNYTQCAHIVWYAYKHFGFDTDSNGGPIVKPRDMANSEYFEVVQIYGIDPVKLWG